ncbi:Rgd3p LALA0_S07e04302g [Lachancea lanzarotensis]|uniref:LALA0S07e04302g1_1 n=1 Tax=Lachancea lanzarotensis TaxID=1245769 RepID=A0A0C7N5G9_9SACH|nr:uncharacterized protein LALA0_S07e04302g [Lachancea lanzarotensis]CEP63183.1 LALA0S07e04302g1_1 [Lachancea lanzarotensis]
MHPYTHHLSCSKENMTTKNDGCELMKATFWSEDYATGIESLLGKIQTDISELTEMLILIKTYDSEIISPATKALKKLVIGGEKPENDTSLCTVIQKQQLNTLTGILVKLEHSSHSKLESQCQIPLESLLFEYNEYLQETKDATSRAMKGYSKHLLLAKQMQNEYEAMAARLRQMLRDSLFGDDNQVLPSQEYAIKDVSHAFPLTIDKSIVIDGEEQLILFCAKLKENIITSNRLIKIPGIANEYFSGTKLLDALKKIEPKLEISLFNLERVGQKLLAADIIRPYQNIMGAQSRFAADDYYTWGSTQSNQESVSNTRPAVNTVFGGFFKRVSGGSDEQTPITTLAELESYRHEFTKRRSSFFQQCQNLDYWRSQLELELQKAMHHYWKLLLKKIDQAHLANSQFLSLLQGSFPSHFETESIDPTQELQRVYRSNHSTIGFYVPQPGVTFSKYDVNGELTGTPLFHSELRNSQLDETGVAVILRSLLKQLETHNADDILKAWSLPLDLQRNSRLRRDCYTEFLAAEGDHSTTLTNMLARKGQNVNDVVGLLQSWLLELPDSLIPMACYEDVKEKGISGLKRCSKEHVLHLAAMCEHFQWLVHHCGDVEVMRTFTSRIDFPLYHIFARDRIQKPRDYEVMSTAVHDVLCGEGNSQRLVEMLAVDREPNVARLSVEVPMHSSSATFVPRPLKSLSTSTSAASSRPASQRISGIDLLGRDT